MICSLEEAEPVWDISFIYCVSDVEEEPRNEYYDEDPGYDLQGPLKYPDMPPKGNALVGEELGYSFGCHALRWARLAVPGIFEAPRRGARGLCASRVGPKRQFQTGSGGIFSWLYCLPRPLHWRGNVAKALALSAAAGRISVHPLGSRCTGRLPIERFGILLWVGLRRWRRGFVRIFLRSFLRP